MFKRRTLFVVGAERLVFLGFAYGEQNMALLKPPKPMKRIRVYGTALGLSKSDREVVATKIAG
jgi:hypothetical protein